MISHKHFNPQPKAKKTKLSPFQYSKLKTKMWKDQDEMCSRCLKYLPRDEAQFHHIIKRSQGGAEIMDGNVNGEIVCWKCHHRIHNDEIKDRC